MKLLRYPLKIRKFEVRDEATDAVLPGSDQLRSLANRSVKDFAGSAGTTSSLELFLPIAPPIAFFKRPRKAARVASSFVISPLPSMSRALKIAG